ncbi:hypothetical protein FS749_007282 [Ceratobasidium sp. UAMH 11750]|nr:hypothetical protein FS749_007282 [Ceratobasidium sp. UAMH 11750]
MHSVIDTDNIWMTCATWVTNDTFFAGFSDGRVYFGLVKQSEFFMKLFAVPTPGSLGTITAIAFNKPLSYLAFSTSHEVIIARHDGTASEPCGPNVVDRSKPFDEPESVINSLFFYGITRLSLVVGGTAGLVVYLTHSGKPRIILANHDFKIAHCAISRDRRLLAASTLNNQIVVWPLGVAGPLIHATMCFNMPSQGAHSEHASAPSVTITPLNIVVGAASTRHLFFVSVLEREKPSCMMFSKTHSIHAVVAHGKRLFLAATCTTNPNRITFASYTQSPGDLTWSQPHKRYPHFKHLEEAINHFGGPERWVGDTEISLQISFSHSGLGWLKYCFLALVVAALGRFAVVFWQKCTLSLKDVALDGLTNGPGVNLVSAGVCFIHFYVLHSLIASALNILAALIYAY